MTKKKIEKSSPKMNSAEASQVIAKELERRRMACVGEIVAALNKYGFEQQATMTIYVGRNSRSWRFCNAYWNFLAIYEC